MSWGAGQQQPTSKAMHRPHRRQQHLVGQNLQRRQPGRREGRGEAGDGAARTIEMLHELYAAMDVSAATALKPPLPIFRSVWQARVSREWQARVSRGRVARGVPGAAGGACSSQNYPDSDVRVIILNF